ncbi:MAG: type II secretion system protein GspN [bacterium]
MKRLLLVSVAFLVLLSVALIGLWFFGVPDRYVSDRIEQIPAAPFRIEMRGFSKKLFFQFTADSLQVSGPQGEVWKISELRGRVDPFQLFLSRAIISVQGLSYGGAVGGTMRFERKGSKIELVYSGIDFSAIPSVKERNIQGTGKLSGELAYGNQGGDVRFVLNDASIAGISSEGMYVPLRYFHTIRGAMKILTPQNVAITAISLEGKNIYARLKGNIMNGTADLGIEIMPETSFEDSSLMMLLDRYKISDGYYFIPIKTTL